ncbi:MAG: histidine kinase [Clostridia bacterium]|nr:histidine kinase [Clostridia bacterium]
MNRKEHKNCKFNITTLQMVGVLLILVLAVALLWHSNANSNQAQMPLVAKIYFDGEYRIGDGPWQEIVEGGHIPSTQGDVTLRGNFHILAPDGEYVGPYTGDELIAFYTDHLSLTFFIGEDETYVIDSENPLFGDAACGQYWTAFSYFNENADPIEILVHNPHAFGNETAIDEMLSNVAFWTGIEFEKGVLDSGETERNVGVFFIIASMLFLGSALFSTLIHIKNSTILWPVGIVIFFAGLYMAYSADGVSFWKESIVSNTILLGSSMMFYMLFLCMIIVHFLKGTRAVGLITIAVLGITNMVAFAVPLFTDVLFYDTWLYWASLQIIANIILFGCLTREFIVSKGKSRWLCLGLTLPLVSFVVDVVMINLGIWNTGSSSKAIFMLFFIVAVAMAIRVIPNSINALARAKELETEKIKLNNQLSESRISTMMSQIRPHFIYNTLGSIEQLCVIDPPKAGELVHNFSKYLRGNFRELDNPKPIPMTQEMDHVHHYVSIENVRFPDMTFSFEMRSSDFNIPALTIQPIVENAIKHGLMKLPKGGTIRVLSYETDMDYCVTVEDDGVGFDTSLLVDERKHVGIRNIRARLEAMVNGVLEIESTVGVGTKVTIKIPKEVS